MFKEEKKGKGGKKRKEKISLFKCLKKRSSLENVCLYAVCVLKLCCGFDNRTAQTILLPLLYIESQINQQHCKFDILFLHFPCMALQHNCKQNVD